MGLEGGAGADAWQLDWIRVASGDKEWYFHCKGWLGGEKPREVRGL